MRAIEVRHVDGDEYSVVVDGHESRPLLRKREAERQARQLRRTDLAAALAHPTLAIPRGLSRTGRTAAHAILALLGAHDALDTGGCRAFYTPAEWRERGEKYGLTSALIVVHDGGAIAPWFNMDYDTGAWRLVERMSEALEKVGVYAEPCTCWYTAIYSKE